MEQFGKLKIIFILGLLVLLIFCLAVGTYFYFWYEVNIPLTSKTSEQEFIVEKGMGSKEIAMALKQASLIRNANAFCLYAWLRGFHHNLQAGRYILSPSYDIKKNVAILASGKVEENFVKVTIPEGFTNQQIDTRLLAADFKEKISVVSLKVSDFGKEYSFLSGIPTDNSLQGFFFPDTYFFNQESTRGEVVKKILDNFDKKVTPDLREKINAQGRTLYDILKMASLLEKEVRSAEDKKIVAGIFWQRLTNGQPLESCATIAYILGKDKPRYSFEETRIPSPYNTYLNLGLPPTPINNPGLEAIIAAVYPQASSYNYFLTDPETGQTIFAKTLKEHNENKAEVF